MLKTRPISISYLDKPSLNLRWSPSSFNSSEVRTSYSSTFSQKKKKRVISLLVRLITPEKLKLLEVSVRLYSFEISSRSPRKEAKLYHIFELVKFSNETWTITCSACSTCLSTYMNSLTSRVEMIVKAQLTMVDFDV